MERRFPLSSPAGKSLVPLAREDARQDPFLGCTIRKIFGSQWYHGQVIAIDVDVASGERAYHIAYEDGDEEHLSGAEVRNFLAMASRSAPPSEAGSPRRSLVPSQRPSLARTEAPRPSVAPSISPPVAAPAMASLSTFSVAAAKPAVSFWGSMLLAAITGAFMVAMVSSFLSFLTAGELADAGSRPTIPMGLVAPLPPWAEVEAQLPKEPKVSPGGGAGAMIWEEPSPLKDAEEKPPPALPIEVPPEPVETIQEPQVAATTSPPSPPEVAAEPPEPSVKLPKDELHDVTDDHLAAAGHQLVDDSVLEEDLSVAVAAVVDASGLVVRVVAKSFFRTLEEVWHWILSSFSSGISGVSFGGSSEAPPPPEPLPPAEPEEAAGALQSLMTTILVACAGVMTILVNIHPPPSVAQELQDAVHMHEAKMPVLPFHAPSPRPSPAAPFPSPAAPMAPLQEMQKAQVRQLLESVNTPARHAKSALVHPEAIGTPSKSATDGARRAWNLMTMMGRTPQGGTTLPVASSEGRRPPPPPKSLMVGAEMSAPLPRSQETCTSCARCSSTMPADANFCRYCGQQRGKRVTQAKSATPPPPRRHEASTREVRTKSQALIVDQPRFRYSSGLKKLKEMGYGDTQELRNILTKCSGDLSAALRMINGSSPRIRA